MNRRADDRIEMKLPCEVLFPKLWLLPLEGVTANLHRNGILIGCDLSSIGNDLPALGETVHVRVMLPANHSFGRKTMDCEASLVRIMQTGFSRWQLAVRVHNMSFGDWSPSPGGESLRWVI